MLSYCLKQKCLEGILILAALNFVAQNSLSPSKDVKTVLSNNLTKPHILTHTFCSVTTEQITYILDHLLMLLQNIFNQTLYVTYERTQSMCFCLSEFSLKKMTKNSSFSV